VLQASSIAPEITREQFTRTEPSLFSRCRSVHRGSSHRNRLVVPDFLAEALAAGERPSHSALCRVAFRATPTSMVCLFGKRSLDRGGGVFPSGRVSLGFPVLRDSWKRGQSGSNTSIFPRRYNGRRPRYRCRQHTRRTANVKSVMLRPATVTVTYGEF